MKNLAALDNSDYAFNALRKAVDMAKKEQAHVYCSNAKQAANGLFTIR